MVRLLRSARNDVLRDFLRDYFLALLKKEICVIVLSDFLPRKQAQKDDGSPKTTH
jgi:hypothetical protein